MNSRKLSTLSPLKSSTEIINKSFSYIFDSKLKKFLSKKNKVKLLNMLPEDFKSVFVTIKESSPDEVYFLAGQTSVGLSFELPMETLNSITIGTLNILEACKIINNNTKIYTVYKSPIINPSTDNCVGIS